MPRKNRFNSFTEFPADLQKRTIDRMIDILEKGGSLQLVGVPGSGNSILIKAMIQRASKGCKDKNSYEKLHFTVIDGNLLLKRGIIAMSRLLLSSLAKKTSVPKDYLVIHREIQKEVSHKCINGRLVIVFDHVEEFNLNDIKRFGNYLYDLSRRHDYKISFIFAVLRPIDKTAGIRAYGSLGKLISENVIPVLCLKKKDAFWFIKEQSKIYGSRLNEKKKIKVWKISGGFPRIMKKIVELLGRGYDLDQIEDNPKIDTTLNLLLDDLSHYRDVITDTPILERYLHLKKIKGLEERLDWLQLTSRLTKNEEKLLKLFIKHEGCVVERNNAIEKLWGAGNVEISNHAYDQIVHRLRHKLEHSSPPVYIETVRGRGHVLRKG